MKKFMIHLSFADLSKFPGGLMCIICQVTEYCLESDDLSCHDYACEILGELEKLNEKELLLENDDDANFFVASMNIVASTKFNSEFDLDSRDIIYTLVQGSPLESVIQKFNLIAPEILEVFKRADVCGGRYNERLKTLFHRYD